MFAEVHDSLLDELLTNARRWKFLLGKEKFYPLALREWKLLIGSLVIYLAALCRAVHVL
jgi:hypothetical protein